MNNRHIMGTLTIGVTLIALAASAVTFSVIKAQQGGSFTIDCDYTDTGSGIQVDNCSGFIAYTATPPPTSTPDPTSAPTPTSTATPTVTPTPTSTKPAPTGWHPVGILVREGVDMGDICCTYQPTDTQQAHGEPRYTPLIDPAIDRIVLAPGGIHDQGRQQAWCDEVEATYPGIEYYFYHTSTSIGSQLGTTCPTVGYYHYSQDQPGNVQAIADQVHNAGRQFVLGIDGTRSDVNQIVPVADAAIVQLSHACQSGASAFAQAVDNLPAHPNLMVGITLNEFSDGRDIVNGVSVAQAEACHNELVQRGIPMMRYDHPLSPGQADTLMEDLRGITIQARPASSPQCGENGNVHPCWPPLGTP